MARKSYKTKSPQPFLTEGKKSIPPAAAASVASGGDRVSDLDPAIF